MLFRVAERLVGRSWLSCGRARSSNDGGDLGGEGVGREVDEGERVSKFPILL